MKLFSYTTMLAVFIAQFVNSQDIKLNGTISAENNQIKNVADPTVAQDVATKNYVDSVGIQGPVGPQGPQGNPCLLYTSPSPRDKRQSRMPSSA